jgi:hypothetical protein
VYSEAANGATYLSQNGFTTHEKALTMKLIHAYHHKKADYLNGDDVRCLNRILFPILVEIKNGRALLESRNNAQQFLAQLDSVQSAAGAIYTQFHNKVAAIFSFNPMDNPEDENVSDAARNLIQDTQIRVYSTTCNSRAGILSFSDIYFLVAFMAQTGWIKDLNLAWYLQSSCNCKLMDTWGPEVRQAAVLQLQQEAVKEQVQHEAAKEQAAAEAKQAYLASQGTVASQEDRHAEDGEYEEYDGGYEEVSGLFNLP